ncbi:hypothetical protein RND81_04G152700 [Saponaria officinalis]|uniref:U-box domain-containing protein n=1 Tax=Saponaria officinalis TaxID=3572 RepID=A0AAW1LM03_SAPOF
MVSMEVEIPSHFTCPISLQLMKDPVTIVTGITYDRDHIEKWLFTYKHATCPVTNQVLLNDRNHHDDHEKHMVIMMITPNHTLRRLIQSWCVLHASDGVERISTPKGNVLVDHAYVSKLLYDVRQSTKLRYSCMQKILSLATSSDDRIKRVLESCGVFDYLVIILLEDDYEKRDKEVALSIFAQIIDDYNNYESIFKGLIKDTNGNYLLFIGSVVELLRSGSVQVREDAVKVLRAVYKVSNPNQISKVTFDVVREVVNVIRDNISNQCTKFALKILVDLNPWGRNRVKVVGSGLVQVLVDLLIDGLDRRLNELVLVVLDQLCGCAEGRADLVGHAAGIAVVSKKILRVSHVATDRAVKILSLISRYLATGRVVGEMMEVGVVAKLCLVVQVECSLKTKERAKEMLRLHSSVWKLSPCIPPQLLSSYPSS